MLFRISTGQGSYQTGKSGITLIEILIVTVIIGLMAAISFPVFKIIQQREKERRLKKYLYDVRSAISGSKSPQSATDFTEGFRTYIRVKGIALIEAAHTPAEQATCKEAISVFVNNLGVEGKGYPQTPSALTTTFSIDVATSTADPANDFVRILVDRKFLRILPPHPFKNWYPNARWEFRPAIKKPVVTENTLPATSAHWGTNASGVVDIVSRGAGIALDGSLTDDL